MNAEAFCHFYNYHFSENRKVWDGYITSLTYEQFIQPVDYSHGSVRNQIVHLMDVEDTWFSGLRGIKLPEPFACHEFDDRTLIRTHWDEVEQNIRGYLGKLRDETLFEKPFPTGEDQDLIQWQVLLHVVNHGTDHRAQILRILHDLGLKTGPQDYIFYVYDHT
jgi:uncharacterized damage-inducible protein DinB